VGYLAREFGVLTQNVSLVIWVLMKKRIIAGILVAIAVISILATGCNDGTNSVANSTNSPSATPLKPDLLTTCPVTGDPLGSMGTPYVLDYKGQEVKFCCAGCTNDFFKDPEKYMKIIRAADKAAKR
jgi:YHS domain-containing protein